MGKENLHGRMELYMKVNLQIIGLLGKECIAGLMVVCMREK